MPCNNGKHIGIRRKQRSNPATRGPQPKVFEEFVEITEAAARSPDEPDDEESDGGIRISERDDGYGEVITGEHRREAIAVAFGPRTS